MLKLRGLKEGRHAVRDAVCTQDDAKMMAGKSGVCVHTKKTMILLWCRRRRKERKLFVQIFFSFASFIMIIKRWNSFLYYFLSTTFLNRLRFSLDFWKESLVWIFSSCVLHILCLCELYYPSVSSNIFFQIRYSKKFRFKNLFSTICWRPVLKTIVN